MTTQPYTPMLKRLCNKMSIKLSTTHIETIEKIISAMHESKLMLIEAPTGWGKTIVSVFATLIYNLNYQEERPIIYTSKTHNVLIKVFNLYKMLLSGIPDNETKIILYVGKEKLCPYSITQPMDSDDYIYGLCEYMRYNSLCSYYINYLSKFGEATDFLIKNWRKMGSIINRDEIIEPDTCLYYTIKNSLQNFDIIITSYFNVFSNIKNYIINITNYKMPILIIDEVHNLPKYYFDLITCKIDIKDMKHYNDVYKIFNNIIDKVGEGGVKLADHIDLETLYSNKVLLDEKLRKFFDWKRERHRVSSLYKTRLFLNYALLKYDKIFLYYDKNNNLLYLVPIEEIVKLPMILNNYYSVIGLSATLSPQSLFSSILFGNYTDKIESVIISEYPNFLPKPNIQVYHEYTSRYRDRTISMIERLAKKILEITVNDGSTAVYAASYELSEYLKKELNRLKAKYTGKKSYIHILDNLTTSNYILKLFNDREYKIDDKKMILVTSQRGKLSEGIDLPPVFKNIVIYGLSIPPFNLEDYLFTKYMLKTPVKEGNPTEAQILSTVLSVIQSIGRVLRKGRETVNIYIFDWRFTWKRFKKYIPRWFLELMN